MTNKNFSFKNGIPEEFRQAAVDLYDEAFGFKFSLAIPDMKARKQVLYKGFDLKNAVGAFNQRELVGIAGFHGKSGSLTQKITYQLLLKELGPVKGNRAALVFMVYDRKKANQELLMDGLAVRSDMRGCGLGSRLLDEIKHIAESSGHSYIRLDVIDTNPRAKKLYERYGFKTVSTEQFGYLKWLFGFGGVSRMQFTITDG